MSKKILYGTEAKEAIQRGVEKLADAVRITLGPKGKNVALKTEFNSPVIINDGVSIAKEIELEDEMENIGAELLKEVAMKTNDVAGDGTTTATVLAYNMVKTGMKNIAAGSNPIFIKRGMQKTLDESVKYIKEISQSVGSNDQIKEIASISANDRQIGELISRAIDMIGKEGVITVDESKTLSTNLNIVEGLKIDSGYISSYMVNDNLKMEEVLENPYILITNKKITSVQEILPIIEKIASQNRSLLLIVEDIEGEGLATLLVNKMRGSFNSIAIKAPSFGDKRKEILEDIATVTGGKMFDEETFIDLKDVGLEDLGCAKSVKVTKDSTIILRGCGESSQVESKIEETKNKILEQTDELEIKNLRKRLARLLGGIAVIEVGAATQTELNEKKLRIEDALSATRAAIEEGIVEGGGTAYIHIMKRVDEFVNTLKDDERIGGKIVLESLEKPLYQIAQNAGENGDIVVEKVKESPKEIGYNAINNSFVNMKENGIIDPTKVTRTALENAVSISSMILTTDVAICEINKDTST